MVPTAYPRFLFKGITTYRWKSSNRFLHDTIENLKHILGLNDGQEMVLNAMGYDDSSGKLTFDKDSNKIMLQTPLDPLLPRKVEAFQKLAKKLGGTLFMSRYRSTSVHLLGGCIASSDISSGVCNSDGQVFDSSSPNGAHDGLYICDASIIPCSVGINPCLTIASVAEHVSRRIIKNSVKYDDFAKKDYCRKKGSNSRFERETSSCIVHENMSGEIGGMPCTAYLKMRFDSLQRGEVGGHVTCKSVEMDKMYIIHGEVDLCKISAKTPYTQYMNYHLLLAASSGSRFNFIKLFNISSAIFFFLETDKEMNFYADMFLKEER